MVPTVLFGIIASLVAPIAGGVLQHDATFVFGLEEITLKRNNFISRVPYIGRRFDISFDILPTWFAKGWHNAIHFTVSNRNNAVRGDRIPSIWFTQQSALSPTHKMLVCSDINGNKDLCFLSQPIIRSHKWLNIKISQIHVFGGYYFSVTLNGHTVYAIRNNKAAAYRNVYVYAADNWYANQQGQIKNLIIKTSL